jgi:hypothetical protein
MGLSSKELSECLQHFPVKRLYNGKTHAAAVRLVAELTVYNLQPGDLPQTYFRSPHTPGLVILFPVPR